MVRRRTASGSFVIALRHEGEHPDIAVRFALSLEIARDAGAVTDEVWARGTVTARAVLSLVAMGDFASCYLALWPRGGPHADRRDRCA